MKFRTMAGSGVQVRLPEIEESKKVKGFSKKQTKTSDRQQHGDYQRGRGGGEMWERVKGR